MKDYRVVIEGSRDTRDPTPDELPHIDDYVRRYVEERGGEPMCDHEVPGVTGRVLFYPVRN